MFVSGVTGIQVSTLNFGPNGRNQKGFNGYKTKPLPVNAGCVINNLKFQSLQRENVSSPAGNRTPVSRVTGGDTYHYTTEDVYIRCTD